MATSAHQAVAALSVARLPVLTRYDADEAFAMDRTGRDERYRYHRRVPSPSAGGGSYVLLTDKRLRVWENLWLAQQPSVPAAEAEGDIPTGGPNYATWPSLLSENPYQRMNLDHDLDQPCAIFVLQPG